MSQPAFLRPVRRVDQRCSPLGQAHRIRSPGGLKLLAYLVSVARRPTFRVVAADHVGTLVVLLAGALYAIARWRAPGMGWLVAGVAVSLVALLVQVRRIAFHRHFNHNDLYHVIDMVALYVFFRGAVQLVDR